MKRGEINGVKRVAIGEMGDFGRMQRAGSLADASFLPVPPRTVYSHHLLALPPPTNLHRLLLNLLHLLPRSTGAVFWRRLLLPSTRTASSRLLLAPSACPRCRYLFISGKCLFFDIWGFSGDHVARCFHFCRQMSQMSRHLIDSKEANVDFSCRDIYT